MWHFVLAALADQYTYKYTNGKLIGKQANGIS